jgi:hypothetical protein
MVGHKTESIYRRYAIVDEAMLKEGAVKLHALREAQAPPAPLIPLPTATRTKRVSPRVPSESAVHDGGAMSGRHALSRCRRARNQWWAGTGVELSSSQPGRCVRLGFVERLRTRQAVLRRARIQGPPHIH